MLLCVQNCLVSQHLEESVAKYSRTLAFPGRVCCGPAWYGNGGLNGAIGVAGVWDVSCRSSVPLSDCDASPVFVYVLSSSI